MTFTPGTAPESRSASTNEHIIYPDDHNSNLPSGAARTWFVRQTGGPTVQ